MSVPERAVRAIECTGEALFVVDVGGDHFRAQVCERLRLVGIDVAGDGACREAALRIGKDGADQAAALRPGGADDGNRLALRHGFAPQRGVRTAG